MNENLMLFYAKDLIVRRIQNILILTEPKTTFTNSQFVWRKSVTSQNLKV